MRKTVALIVMLRPHNVAAAVLSVAVGFAMAGGSGWPWALLAAAAFATAAGNTINDIYDVDIDRVNKPARPLPAGQIGVRAAVLLYAFCVAAAIAICSLLPRPDAAWIGIWIVMLHVYSWRLKRMYLAGNVLVAAVAGSGFLLGAHAAGRLSAGAIPAAYTFLFVVGREIVKDVDDIEGDEACRATTFPIVSGRRAALTTALAIFLALCISFPIPSFMGLYRPAYGIIMLLTVVPILLVSIWITLSGRRLGLVSSLLKLGMFFGCVGFYFGPRR
ncbi:MAG TPA: geranylgeranylglycerol-phosphate geranylgeranyltransferase [Candidatus Bathyarchaeia archaeon]|nr:geranylgeranylglycerol-phosphate geranylgeranyltransferase [Candidatus Bathyarchaeia archaeon]